MWCRSHYGASQPGVQEANSPEEKHDANHNSRAYRARGGRRCSPLASASPPAAAAAAAAATTRRSTVWMQHRPAGLRRPGEDDRHGSQGRRASPSTCQKVDNINQLIMTKIQANDTPDIALIPQPGVVADIVKRGAAKPLDDVVDMDALKSDMMPGTLDAGTVDGKLYGAAGQHERQEPGVLPQEGVGRGRLQGPRRRSTSLTRSPTRSRPTAAPRGAWASSPTPPPAGRPPTGSRTWSCATAAPTSTTTGSRTRSSSTPTRCKQAADDFDKLAVHRRQRRRRPRAPSPAPTSATPATRCSTPKPGLLDAQAGQLHHQASSRGHRGRPRRGRRRVRLPARRGRRREPGRSAVATWPRCSTTTTAPRRS